MIENPDQFGERQYNGTPLGCPCFMLFFLLTLGAGLENGRKTRTAPARHALTLTLSQWERETANLQIASVVVYQRSA